MPGVRYGKLMLQNGDMVMNETRKAYEVLLNLRLASDKSEDKKTKELVKALEVALPFVRAGIKCDKCKKTKAVELSDTGKSYCRKCWRAVTDEKSPY